jgi:hypothetical protein
MKQLALLGMLVCGLFAKGQQAEKQLLAPMHDPSLKINGQFRASSEKVLGCIDTLTGLLMKPDSIFTPKATQCSEMSSALMRISSNGKEKAVARALIFLQSKKELCHEYGRSGTGEFGACLEEAEAQRKEVINAAKLRN